MHNGEVPNFCRIRRSLLGRLRDDIFEWISGTTDSELVFALFLNELPDSHSPQPAPVLQAALKSVMALIVAVCKGEPASLNFAVSDGETVLATRFRNGRNEVAPSLYYHLGPMPGEKDWDLTSAGGMDQNIQDGVMFETPPLGCPPPQFGTSPDERAGNGFLHRCPSGFRSSRSLALTGKNTALDPRQSLLVASEPLQLGTTATEWRMVPCNTMLTVCCRWRDGPDAGKVALRADLLEGPAAEHLGAVVLDVTLDSLADLAGCCPVAVAAAVAVSRSHIELASLRSSIDGVEAAASSLGRVSGGSASASAHFSSQQALGGSAGMSAGLPPRCPPDSPQRPRGGDSLARVMSHPILIPGGGSSGEQRHRHHHDGSGASAGSCCSLGDQAPAGPASSSAPSTPPTAACSSPRRQAPGVAGIAGAAAAAVSVL